ncbi:hypothetical protein Aduo_009799 [Ancylostoma duodenale]
MLTHPRYDDVGVPLTVEHPAIEKVIADQLDEIERHRLNLQEMGVSMEHEERIESASFHDQIMDSVKKLTEELSRTQKFDQHTSAENHLPTLVEALHNAANRMQEILAECALRDNCLNNLTSSMNKILQMLQETPIDAIAQRCKMTHDVPTQGAGGAKEPAEDVTMQDEEEESGDSEVTVQEHAGGADTVRANAEFMETVDEGSDSESHDDPGELVRILEEEVKQAQQALRDFEDMIEDLADEKTCAPRRFSNGMIHREDERFLRCAFCNAAGDHYSDSCTVTKKARDRLALLDAVKRCRMCLEIACPEDRRCRKYNTRCYHCKSLGTIRQYVICPKEVRT